MTQTLYIIRGVSGSGKTTLAREIALDNTCLFHEADQYFERAGNYAFDPSKLPAAHKWCQAQVLEDLRSGNPSVVSNTFTKAWELEPYIEMAVNYGCKIKVITCTGMYQNVHGLSDDQVDRQRRRFDSNEKLAQEYKTLCDLGRLQLVYQNSWR